ncbi:hypothetical protein [Rubripirellula tenax]|nr:hypothetical protein [Rubripirellula tenax]
MSTDNQNPYESTSETATSKNTKPVKDKPVPLAKKYERQMSIAIMVVGGFFMLFSLQYIGSNGAELLYTGGGGLVFFLYGLAVFAWNAHKAKATATSTDS